MWVGGCVKQNKCSASCLKKLYRLQYDYVDVAKSDMPVLVSRKAKSTNIVALIYNSRDTPGTAHLNQLTYLGHTKALV